ncbi:MAG: hypothetical protein ISS23_00615 [Nanoarchaeota archaeon]|nr:hypothetical protein [Nanoarchaeota archaeon]
MLEDEFKMEYEFEIDMDGIKFKSERIRYDPACDLAQKLNELDFHYEITEYEQIKGEKVERNITSSELIAGVIL